MFQRIALDTVAELLQSSVSQGPTSGRAVQADERNLHARLQSVWRKSKALRALWILQGIFELQSHVQGLYDSIIGRRNIITIIALVVVIIIVHVSHCHWHLSSFRTSLSSSSPSSPSHPSSSSSSFIIIIIVLVIVIVTNIWAVFAREPWLLTTWFSPLRFLIDR